LTGKGHEPVLLEACIAGLAIKADGVYVDGTLGRGGHSLEIARRLDTGRLIAVDRDAAALREAQARLRPYMDMITLIHGNFRKLHEILREAGTGPVDGILLDLGVSSPQLDEAERGFSYSLDAPLDMRMDAGEGLTAWDVVNDWPEEELRRILFEYGEERYGRRIAREIVKSREKAPIATTGALAEVIKGAMPGVAKREKQHPAKRSFQAIRIAVNDELGAITEFWAHVPEMLRPGGRAAVISFHSLEDRIVKNAIAAQENGCTCPRDFPVCVCGFVQTMKAITKKPILPDEGEVRRNPRARSAKLRVAERV